jgi:hypothetical protein
MPQQAMICPQCNAPLTPHRFAKSAVCPYCGTTVHFVDAPLSANVFRKSFADWNNPASQGFHNYISIGNSHWTLDELLSEEETCDIYLGQRARWPTEMAIIKLLRDEKNKPHFENEWQRIQTLHRSSASGTEIFSRLLPQPIVHGEITGAEHHGKTASVFRREIGWRYSLAEILQANPQGIPVRASIWLWRRILELLTFIHSSGLVQGAVLPQHILIQENEHGARFSNYMCTLPTGEALALMYKTHSECYPSWLKRGGTLSAQTDIVMSARCMISALCGDPEQGTLPQAVPAELANVILNVASAKNPQHITSDAWALREELGSVADKIYGNSIFIPIEMPEQGK